MLIISSDKHFLRRLVTHRTEIAHTKTGDHVAGNVGSLLNIAHSALRDVADNQLFGGSSAHCRGNIRLILLFGDKSRIVVGLVESKASRISARYDGDQVYALSRRQQLTHDGVSRFVISRNALVVFGDETRFFRRAHCHFVYRFVYIFHIYLRAVVAGAQNCRFV